jgi:hypothetical protein
MRDEGRKQRAVEAVTKYKGTLTSDKRIAAFAAWFAEQEFGWKDTRKEPYGHGSCSVEGLQAQHRSSRVSDKRGQLVYQ